MTERGAVALARIRRRLAGRRGTAYWASLEELAETPEFLQRLDQEFPAFARAAGQAYDRRRFLQLMAASLALAGVAACGPETEPRVRVPYVRQPVGIVPGRGRFYATATALQGYGTGVLIEHTMGRPIKVEGNPDHPASLGATGAIDQASILGLYDPYRAEATTQGGRIVASDALATALFERRTALLARHGEGLALLTGAVTSPTLIAQIEALRQQFPAMRRHQWEPVDRETVRAGAHLAFGRAVELVPDFAAADVILAVESDFLDSAPGHLRFARDFATRRRAAEVMARMSRLYAIESTPTLAGAKADHRLAMPPDELGAALRLIAGELQAGPQEWARAAHPQARALRALAADLRRARGAALVHVGAAQPAEVHALGHAINGALGAFGRTVRAIEPILGPPPADGSIAELVAAMCGGRVDTLVILAWNPVFAAPADLGFGDALASVPFSLYLGEYADETAAAARWHVPRAHDYEAWSDIRAFDGTATIRQPQITAMGDRRSPHEVLALLGGDTTPDGLAILREHWRGTRQESGTGFDAFWTETLRAGVVPDTAAAPADVAVRSDYAQSVGAPRKADAESLQLLFRPDVAVWDGRFADNGWLQEMPRPLTRLTWDNAALVAPGTAARLGLTSGDRIEIACDGRTIAAPVWLLPGQAQGCITLPLGLGRKRTGPVGAGVGFDAYPLRTQAALWQADGATLRKLGMAHEFAPVQHEIATQGRDLVREGTLADFLKDPDFLRQRRSDESLYPAYPYDGIAWAMSISLDACVGCQACVVACQAENNSPVIGKTEVMRGRDMHWLRIDRYYDGGPDDPRTVFQPVPCMHCENAPCEVVCPVHATVHDSEGLNVMVYNRCVGTRFCSNNCPYKVRRFNFFDYTAPDPRPRESWNPDVTVRGRGVMEKCTYCVQRTRAAMIDADRENRALRDGEAVTACQQACPTEAIVFGDKNDAASAVAKRKASPLDYVMLDALNTRPRTSYEALIRNPNPDMGDA